MNNICQKYYPALKMYKFYYIIKYQLLSKNNSFYLWTRFHKKAIIIKIDSSARDFKFTQVFQKEREVEGSSGCLGKISWKIPRTHWASMAPSDSEDILFKVPATNKNYSTKSM